MGKQEHAVVVVGGGPTGLMLGAELVLGGADVVVLEQRLGPAPGARSGGLHARTIEVLDQRGIGDRVVEAGQPWQVQRFATELDLGDFPTRRPHGLALWQDRFEEVLAGWVAELGVPVVGGCTVTGVEQDADGVDVTLADGGTLRAAYVVGCDGGRSLVRKASGIPFEGWDATTSSLVAEVRFDGEPELGIRNDARGTSGIGPLGDDHFRVVVREAALESGSPGPEDLRAAMVAVWGSDFDLRDARWLSRFTDAARQAAAYRRGRVLLAGDAAHVHSPVGGQGLNTGLQDAVNLGWKLALVAAGAAPDTLLDSYHAERHPVGARVLQLTMALTALMRADACGAALQEVVAEAVSLEAPRRLLAGRLSGLDIQYDLGEGHPLLGRRMPDLDITTGAGSTHVYAELHDARPVLLNLGAPGAVTVGRWADRVPVVDAGCDGPWELPVLGAVEAPSAVLVRPDGHVAWVGGDGPAEPDLSAALAQWFGPPA